MKIQFQLVLAFFSLITMSCSLHAQRADPAFYQHPATDLEISQIREAFELISDPDWSSDRVLEIVGYHSAHSEFGIRETLHGRVYMLPLEVQNEICVLEIWATSGTPSDSGMDWGERPWSSYLISWMLDQEADCELADSSEIPDQVVRSDSEIPLTALHYTMTNEAELLERYFERVESYNGEDWVETEEDRQWIENNRELLRKFASDSSMVLLRVFDARNRWIEPPDHPVYDAHFGSLNSSGGPAVSYNVTESGFEIFGASEWMY